MGFLVAEVRSFYTQEIVLCHDRFGSWVAGDPDALNTTMRDLVRGLPAALQASRPSDIDKLPVWKGQEMNPFVVKQQKVKVEKGKPKSKAAPVNPFIKKAAKNNPLIAKLLSQGKIG